MGTNNWRPLVFALRSCSITQVLEEANMKSDNSCFISRDALLVGVDEAHQKLSEQLCLSICADNCVVLSELRKISCEWKVPLLLVVPLRLGTEQINQVCQTKLYTY